MEWVTSEAINFINEESNDPFFLYFNPTAPHSSQSVRTALTDFTCRDTANGTLESDPMIEGMTLEYGNCEDYRASVLSRESTDENLGAVWVDDSIGAIMKALEARNQLNNTIFLFQNDHGMKAKSTLYEGGGRIAQFVHYPDAFGAGMTFNGLVSTIDIAPTLLDFAGIEPSYQMDGLSWKDGAMGDVEQTSSFKTDRCIAFEHGRDRAVRCGCFKYLKIYEEYYRSSSTYDMGVRAGYSNDAENLFDLCGGTSEYITERATSMEIMNKNMIYSETNTELNNALECHMTKTDYRSSAVYNVCGRDVGPSVVPPTVAPITPQSSSESQGTMKSMVFLSLSILVTMLY